jgi:hypothetical protein
MLRIVRGDLLDGGEVVEGHAHETGDQRLEAGLHLAVARGGKRCQRAAVEGVLHDDDRGLVDAPLVAVHRASLIAASLASQPELQKNTSSMREMAARRSEAASASPTR